MRCGRAVVVGALAVATFATGYGSAVASSTRVDLPTTAGNRLPAPPHVPRSSYAMLGDGSSYCQTSYVRDLDRFSHPAGPGAVRVRRHPARAWLIYVPGGGSSRSACRARLLRIGPNAADRLARDIDASRVATLLPPCPAPMGRVQVELDYATRPQRLAVSVDLGGCGFIWGWTGAHPRWGSSKVRHDIALAVPPTAR